MTVIALIRFMYSKFSSKYDVYEPAFNTAQGIAYILITCKGIINCYITCHPRRTPLLSALCAPPLSQDLWLV